MVVLNFYGKIEPICISKKLGLYISNLPNEEYNEWRDELARELELSVKADNIYQEKLGANYNCGIINLFQKLFPEDLIPEAFTKEHFDKISAQMICIYQDYDYSDMPLGGWDTNCFDGRFCEEDYSEKIIDFINFIASLDETQYLIPKPVPQWTFSLATLTEQQKEIFEKLRDCESELHDMSELQAFTEGFKLAARLIIKVMQDTERL